jgi:hypothetical protein
LWEKGTVEFPFLYPFIGPHFYFSTLAGILGHHSLAVFLNFPLNLSIQKNWYQHLRTPPQNKKELKRISELEKNPDCIWIRKLKYLSFEIRNDFQLFSLQYLISYFLCIPPSIALNHEEKHCLNYNSRATFEIKKKVRTCWTLLELWVFDEGVDFFLLIFYEFSWLFARRDAGKF